MKTATVERMEALDSVREGLLLLEFGVSGLISDAEHSSYTPQYAREVAGAFIGEVSRLREIVEEVIEQR